MPAMTAAEVSERLMKDAADNDMTPLRTAVNFIVHIADQICQEDQDANTRNNIILLFFYRLTEALEEGITDHQALAKSALKYVIQNSKEATGVEINIFPANMMSEPPETLQ